MFIMGVALSYHIPRYAVYSMLCVIALTLMNSFLDLILRGMEGEEGG